MKEHFHKNTGKTKESPSGIFFCYKYGWRVHSSNLGSCATSMTICFHHVPFRTYMECHHHRSSTCAWFKLVVSIRHLSSCGLWNVWTPHDWCDIRHYNLIFGYYWSTFLKHHPGFPWRDFELFILKFKIGKWWQTFSVHIEHIWYELTMSLTSFDFSRIFMEPW